MRDIFFRRYKPNIIWIGEVWRCESNKDLDVPFAFATGLNPAQAYNAWVANLVILAQMEQSKSLLNFG